MPKGRPRLSKYRVHTPSETAKAEETIKWTFVAATKKKHDPPFPWLFPVRLHLIFGFERAKSNHDEYPTAKADLDNLAKTVCDALNGHAWHDDRQVVSLTATKVYCKTEGIFVLIEAVPTEENEPISVDLVQYSIDYIRRLSYENSVRS